MKKVPLLLGFAVAVLVIVKRDSPEVRSGSDLSWDVTYEEIAAVPDDEVEFYIVEEVTRLMPGTDEPEVFSNFPPGVRAVYTTWVVEAEVGNGGFDQYFLNTEGTLAEEAIAGFRLFGAGRLAVLVEEALLQRGNMEALGRLDDQFYELGSAQAGRVRFIRQNPDSF